MNVSLIFNVLVLFFLNDKASTVNMNIQRNFECKNPEALELQQKLLRHEFDMRMVDKSLFPYDHTHHNTKRSQVYQSLCPTEQYVEYSQNIFPFTFKRKQCKCQKCAFLPKESFKCVPLQEKRFFLKKGNCMHNGIYQWHPFEKNITIGCACKSRFD